MLSSQTVMFPLAAVEAVIGRAFAIGPDAQEAAERIERRHAHHSRVRTEIAPPSLDGASNFAMGMIDGVANLVANMLRVNPSELDAEFKFRFERVVRANLAEVGRKW